VIYATQFHIRGASGACINVSAIGNGNVINITHLQNKATVTNTRDAADRSCRTYWVI